MPVFMMMAEAAVDISSGAGWAGAGILTGVLGWLLFVHLPSKDKQVKESFDLLKLVYTECQARIDRRSEDYARREKERDAQFTEALTRALAEITEKIDDIGKAIYRRIDKHRSPES